MKITKAITTELAEEIVSKVGKLTWEDTPEVFEVAKRKLETMNRLDTTVIAVYCDGIPVWYLTGRKEDVEAYAAEQGIKDPVLEPIKVSEVPYGYANKRANILAKRERLLKELERLNREMEI